MTDLRIFSYMPNPRIWKATIAARLNGAVVEVRGAAPDQLPDWLWDFDARPLTEADRATASGFARIGKVGFKGGRLHKTDTFLAAHPFGTVPAAFAPDGGTGIFESNSIMRAVARLGQDGVTLYGNDPYEASRIDSFLDVSLVFARDAQIYLLALRGGTAPADVHVRAAEAFATYMAGMAQALRPNRKFLVGEDVTLADICFACEVALFSVERRSTRLLAENGLTPISAPVAADHAEAWAHFAHLAEHPAFAPDMRPYLDAIDRHAAA